MTDHTISIAVDPDDLSAVKALFIDYTKGLGIDLGFQGIAEEFKTFPGKYDLLLLARDGGSKPVGAVGSWTLAPGVCEMKRLYVDGAARGMGLGRDLSIRLMAETRALGFHTMKLDTLARLTPAKALYESLGFTPTTPYNHNPEPDILYYEIRL